jgi:hypothetical protein
MILEYQKDRNNPPPFNYIDPITGAEDKLKYFPSTFIVFVVKLLHSLVDRSNDR